MSDMICRKTMRACLTPGMCAPFGGCRETVVAPPPAADAVSEAMVEAALREWHVQYTRNGQSADYAMRAAIAAALAARSKE